MNNNKSETSSVTLFVLSIVGIFICSIIIEPIVLYKAIKKNNKDAFDIIAIVVSGFILGFFGLAFLAGLMAGLLEII